MPASDLPFNEPLVNAPVRRSRKVQAFAAFLIGFGLGCAAIYVAGWEPLGLLQPTINMAMPYTQPFQASRFMQRMQPMPQYPMQPVVSQPLVQPVSALPYEHDEPTGRREMMTGLAAASAGASLLKDQAAFAAYGDGANVFGSITNPSGFNAYAGDGFSLLIPSKWNPSKEQDFPGAVFRYEDNFDAVTSLVVIKQKTDKTSVDGYGSPVEFLSSFSYLLGKQSYSGKTMSEGGFAPDRVSAASVLDAKNEKDKKGRTVYSFNILSRTADGDEGGRHQLISARVSDGTLYIFKVQVGDKRWLKGAKKEAEGSFNSFTVA